VISFIVPTLGRSSLRATLDSIECLPGDEVIVIGNVKEMTNVNAMKDVVYRFIPCSPGGDWGHKERNIATLFARGDYLAHIDDDDVYAPGTRALMADAIERTPGRPVLFRMRYPNGITLWQEPKLFCGNVGTPMILIPNVPSKLGQFKSFVGGDCAYLEDMKWSREEIVWRSEVIALLGHNT
jgi:hypothetical protein